MICANLLSNLKKNARRLKSFIRLSITYSGQTPETANFIRFSGSLLFSKSCYCKHVNSLFVSKKPYLLLKQMANCKKQYLFDHLKLSGFKSQKELFPEKAGKNHSSNGGNGSVTSFRYPEPTKVATKSPFSLVMRTSQLDKRL